MSRTKFPTVGRFMALAAMAALPLCAFQLPPQPPEPPEPPEAPTPPSVFSLHAPGLGNQSFLGVGVAEITANRMRELNLKEEYGVEITRVEDESPASKAGLKVGDVVVGYNGQRVEGIEQFMRLVRETPVGREVKLLISRNGVIQTIPVKIGTRRDAILLRHDGDWSDMPPSLVLPDMPRVFTTWNNAMLGIEAEALNPQLGEFFGVKEGVLIRSVAKGSAAEKAGLKAGDVIVKVDQTKVVSPSAVSAAIRTARAKKTFPVDIVRDHRSMTVPVTVSGDQADQNWFSWPRSSSGRTVKM